MLEAIGVYWRLVLRIAAPIVATLVAWTSLLTLLLGESEFNFFDHGRAPEDSARIAGIAAVTILNILSAAIISDLTRRAEPGLRFARYLRKRVGALSLLALAAVGMAFAVLDMTFCLGESTEGVLIALTLGLLAIGPILVDRAIRLRTLLAVLAIYAVFTFWIAGQRNIDWNMRRHFLRAYAQIKPGMTRIEVERIMRNHFGSKRPLSRFDDSGVLFTLDPDDGRFNSEIIDVRMLEGKVVEADYLRD